MFPRALFTANPYTRGTQIYASSGLLDLLPAANRLAIWYAGDGTGGGSYISAADGAAVGSFVDAVASLTLSSSGTNRPTYRQSVAAFNNRGAVEFSAAASQYLEATVASALAANLTTYSIYVVFATTSTAVSEMYYEGRNISSTPIIIARYNNTGLRSLHRSDGNVSANIAGGSGYNDGTAHLFTLKRTASNAFQSYGDGTSLGTSTGAPGTTTVDRIALGRFSTGGGTSYFTGQLAAVILYSADNRTTVEPILNTHYGM